MSKSKRLFLFAGYDKLNTIDKTLEWYVSELSKLGDVILCMDSDCDEKALKRISEYTIHTIVGKHSEYDFGSYKRAYLYAYENNLLENYEFVYIVNDSVYGPLSDLSHLLEQMESFNTNAFGMAESVHHKYTHIQSWFVGFRKQVFLTEWFKDFLADVKHLPDKGSVTILYENGLTKLVEKHGYTWKCVFQCPGRSVYNEIKKLFKQGMPFMKKNAVIRHNGALAQQIIYILKYSSMPADYIKEDIDRLYGKKYRIWLLSSNIIQSIYRHIRYGLNKLIHGEI